MIIKLFLLIIAIDLSICVEPNNVKVKTSSGVFEGRTANVFNHKISEFLGIPFAEPPVGELRFAKPLPLKTPLEGVIDATKPKNSCVQSELLKSMTGVSFNLTESEDCLVLNIWSPNLPSNETGVELKPVMFWIYGGGFMSGSIFQLPIYDGKVLASNDVIVVSANYRLGIFGFLYGGQESAPGNLGFYDLTLALKWVQQNIHLFGGDPNKITVFGESAGSMSVGALVLSPVSQHLFQRAILQSGSPFFSKRNKLIKNPAQALEESKHLSLSFNCSNDNKWLDCLRNIEAAKINKYLFIPYLTTNGSEFFPFTIENAFKSDNISKDIELMIGVTKNEGTLLGYMNFPKLNATVNKDDLSAAIKLLIPTGVDPDLVSKHYLSNIDPNNQTALKLAFGDFYGELEVTCPTYFFAKEFSSSSPKNNVYFYELTHKHKGEGVFGCGYDWMGICHGSDLTYTFGTPLLMGNFSSQIDKDFSKLFMNLWTNFAKIGNPIANQSITQWPTLRKSSESQVIFKAMELNPQNFGHILDEPFKANCDGFWKQFFYA